MNIKDVEMSTRLRNALENNGIKRLESLAEMTPAALVRMRRLGPKSLLEIREVLDEHGMKLSGDDDASRDEAERGGPKEQRAHRVSVRTRNVATDLDTIRAVLGAPSRYSSDVLAVARFVIPMPKSNS